MCFISKSFLYVSLQIIKKVAQSELSKKKERIEDGNWFLPKCLLQNYILISKGRKNGEGEHFSIAFFSRSTQQPPLGAPKHKEALLWKGVTQ